MPPSVINGVQSFFSKGSAERGVLLLHGFLGNPGELIYCAEKFRNAGFTVSVPRYPGHGTTIDEMAASSVDAWFTAAREAYMELASIVDRVYIAGLSMGGLFSLRIAGEFPVERICLISVPRGLPMTVCLAPVIGLFVKVIPPSNNKKGINSPELREAHICYHEGTPVKQVWQLNRFIRKTMRALPRVRSSVLILQSDGDEVIPRDSADYIFNRIGSHEKKKFIFRKSNHVITNDYDREEAAEMMLRFFSC
jgi:carboxylesterase